MVFDPCFDPCAPAQLLPIQGRTFGIARHDRLPASFHRQSGGNRVMAAFRLAHLSDPHLPPLPKLLPEPLRL